MELQTIETTKAAEEKDILRSSTLKTTPSEEVQEFISRKPHFVERWALAIFFLVLFILFVSTWFVKYNDVLQATGILTAANAPKEIVPKQEGKLVKLFVANDAKVNEGDLIGWIESTGSHKQILALDSLINSAIILLENDEMEKASKLFESEMLQLGDVQPSYQQFITAWQQFNDFFVNGYCYKKKQQLLKDKTYLQQLHYSLEEQKQLSMQDLQLTSERFDANTSLFKDNVISKQELRDEKSKLLSKEMTKPQTDISLLNNEMQELSKQKELDELDHNISLQKNIFEQALHTLKSAVEAWTSKYVIKAAVTGKVVFVVLLQENQFLTPGKVLGYINPADAKYYVQANLTQANFGKLAVGQNAQLRFDAYPYQEFGHVNGVLKYISNIPSDTGFLSTIELPKGLITSAEKKIYYRHGLKCQIIISTKETRLMQRFFYDILKEIQH